MVGVTSTRFIATTVDSRAWPSLVVGAAIVCGLQAPWAPTALGQEIGPARPPFRGGELTYPAARGPGAEPAPAAGWLFDAAGALDLTYTDNAFLTETDRRGDLITTPQASLMARRTSLRSILNAKADIAYDFYAENTRLNGVRPSALIDGAAEVVEETLTVDGRLATDLRQVSAGGRVPATRRTLEQNQTQILSYGFTPTLHRHLGPALEAEASYDLSGVNFLDPPAGNEVVGVDDTVRQGARARLWNGDNFTQFGWSVAGYYETASPRGTLPRSERSRAEAAAEYRLSSPWSLTARGGYEWIDESTLRTELDGPYALAGAIFRPSTRTRIRAEAGYRYRDFNAEAEALYQFSPALIVSASYVRDVQTSQRLLSANLSNLVRDELGNLVDPITGLFPDPNSIDFDLTNQAFKRDHVRLGIHGIAGRNFYNISARYERRSANGLDGESRGGEIMIGRDLTPRLQASANANHARLEADAGLSGGLRDSKTTGAGARLDYEVTRTMTASARYIHIRRTTTLVRYSENAIVLNLTQVF